MENIGNMEHGKYKNYLKFDNMEINNIKGAMTKKYINGVNTRLERIVLYAQGNDETRAFKF